MDTCQYIDVDNYVYPFGYGAKKIGIILGIFMIANFVANALQARTSKQDIFPIASKIGIFWFITLSFAVIMTIPFPMILKNPDYAGVIFPMMTSIGMIVTGLFSEKYFLYIGIVFAVLIVPLLIFAPHLILIVQGISGLGMGIGSLLFYLKTRK